jgi:uncharacterized membrane protein
VVEKRFGIGWTLNFAHRVSWVFVGLILAALMLAVGMPLLTKF